MQAKDLIVTGASRLLGKLKCLGDISTSGKVTVGAAPTNNMDVATKKYVDDAVSSNLMIITISRSSATYISDKTFNEIRSHVTNGGTVVCKTNYYNDENDYNVYHLVHNDSNYLAFAYFKQYLDTDTSQLWYSASQITITNSNVIMVDGVVTGSYAAPSSTTPKALGTASIGSEYAFARGDHVHPTDTTRAAVSDVLTKTNTTSYTPTADYHPATKKYVDGLSLTISGNTIQLKQGTAIRSSITLPVWDGGVS